MKNASGRILKSNDFVLEGSFCLDSAPSGTQQQKNKKALQPEVKIIENQNEYAVISITCSCGTQTLIKCEYAGADSVVN